MNTLVRTFLAGVATAAIVDFTAFGNAKSLQELVKFDWGLAVCRWVIGGVLGVLASIGATV